MSRIIDIHSHINFPLFDDDREALIVRMKEEGIGTITIGTNLETSKEAIALAEKHDHLWASVGMHPTDEVHDFDTQVFEALALHERVVCIGECGLDYFRLKDDEKREQVIDTQKEVFKAHIDIAREVGKPLMIHARPAVAVARPAMAGGRPMDAYQDVLDILESHTDIHAHFHFFVGDMTIAKRIIKNGWTVSFDGPITFSTDYDEVIKFLPLESIMIETDAPFASPAPHRGKRNEPLYVIHIAEKIAELKGESIERVLEVVRQNTRRVFGI